MNVPAHPEPCSDTNNNVPASDVDERHAVHGIVDQAECRDGAKHSEDIEHGGTHSSSAPAHSQWSGTQAPLPDLTTGTAEEYVRLRETDPAQARALGAMLLARSEKYVKKLLVIHGHPPAEVDDLAQIIFLEAQRNLHQMIDPKAFPGWLRKVVFSRSKNFKRSQGAHSFHYVQATRQMLESAVDYRSSDEDGVTEHGLTKEEKLELEQAVSSLAAMYRDAIRAVYYHGQTPKSLHESLGIPHNTVKRRLFAGRNRLRKILEEKNSILLAYASQSDRSRA